MTYTLHHGDCLTVLREMPAQSVDLVFTSPPYNKGESAHWTSKAQGGTLARRTALEYTDHDDNMPWEQYVTWLQDVLRECWRVLRPTGAIYFNHKPRPFNKELQTPLLFNPGLPLRQIIIWYHRGCVNYSRSHYAPTCEWVCVFAGKDFNLKDRSASKIGDVWCIPPEPLGAHPAPFPVALPRRALESTESRIVLDPFCGSGSTGVAALELGRQFIGIDISRQYLDLAEARLAAVTVDA